MEERSAVAVSAAPNLFIVGAPRCGTSTMFRLLARHPHVSVSTVKEPYYFCTDFHEESDRHHGRRMRFPVRSETEYLALFPEPRGRIVAEASTGYLRSRTAAANIRAFNPGARIIAMVREPVELLRSLHAKFVSNGHEDLPDFQQAIEAEPERRSGRRLPRGLYFPSSLHYSEWISLADQVERYRGCFGSDRVKVFVYDDFQRDSAAAYDDVVGFLALDPFRVEAERRNENQSARIPWLARTAARLGDLPIKHLISESRRRHIRRALKRVNLKPVSRPPLDPGFRGELMLRFRPEVERLGAVLQRDLISLWGYDRLIGSRS